MCGGGWRSILGLVLVVVVLGTVDVSADVKVVERPDVTYAPGVALDAFLPAGHHDPVPAVLFVHGGGWRTGDKRGWSRRARTLVRQTGMVAFAVNYDLDATEPYLTQPNDLRAAIAWVRANAVGLGVDPTRIGLIGSSAGGHLAMLVATTSTGADRVSAVVSWSGISDLPRLARSPRGDQVVKDLAVRYSGGPLNEHPDRWSEESPVDHVDRSDPPMLLAGSADETMVPVDQLEVMRDALRARGVEAVDRIFPGTRHASSFGDDVWDETVQFLVRHL